MLWAASHVMGMLDKQLVACLRNGNDMTEIREMNDQQGRMIFGLVQYIVLGYTVIKFVAGSHNAH